MRPYRGRMVVLAVIALTQIVLGLLSPWPLKLVVDNVLGGRAASSSPVRNRSVRWRATAPSGC